MKLKLVFLFFIVFFNQVVAQQVARVDDLKIQSKALNQEREILIYTPPDYDSRTNEYFNVIYIFDCQNREFFDYTTSIISFLNEGNKSFIVVGITSPDNEELDYARNNDMLPVLESENSKARYGKYSGNADNFLTFIASELIPFINTNYRTLDHEIVIGHSLGASFILYSLLEKPNLFENYIAISPNLAFDDDKLSNGLINFDYSRIKNPTFIYLSNANEGIDYWKPWKPARDKVYMFFNDSLKDKNITVKISEFPDKNHWSIFPPSLNNALEFYFENIQSVQEKVLSKDKYEVTVKVKVPEKDDDVYITGNQANLGDWNPAKVKMKKISDYEREITVRLKSPAQFKFTRGNWETEAVVGGTYGNIMIKPETKEKFSFVIDDFVDRDEE